MAKRSKRTLAITSKPKPPNQDSAGRQPTPAQLRKAVASAVAEALPPSKFEQLQMRVIELAASARAIQERLGELIIPSADEVEELKARFRTASTYVDQLRQQVSALADARNVTASEFVSRATFFAWKEHIDERLRALERACAPI
jgi:Tfp pilus assembly protein FimV